MKMKLDLKDRRQQLICVIALFLLSQCVLVGSFGRALVAAWPNARQIERLSAEAAKLRTEYAKIAAERDKVVATKRRCRELAKQSWIISRDGDVETNLRRRISEVAGTQNFKLDSIGAVRTGRINGDFFYAEIDLNGSGELADVIRFIAALRKIEPVLSWRRLDLRSDGRFRRDTTTNSVNLAAQVNKLPPTRLHFNGALRVLGYDGQTEVKK